MFNYQSSTIDWCGSNYVYSNYIAEFWNTVSNILYIIVYFLSFRSFKYIDCKKNDRLLNTLLLSTGISSFYFHATLSLFGQILDEYSNKGVEIRGCKNLKKIRKNISLAKNNDWFEEYLSPIIAIKIVNNLDDAIKHIGKYGSLHTDAIVASDKDVIDKFKRLVNSSSVMINTSTRFADGYEYGLGAEIGISTDKLHVRGPVGLEGLTNLKYIVSSQGKLRN